MDRQVLCIPAEDVLRQNEDVSRELYLSKSVIVTADDVSIGGKTEARDKRIRLAAYCRVSTEHEEQIGSFENQVQYYTDFCERNEQYRLAGIYSDAGISGTGTKKREGFLRMIADAKDGKIDMIITKSISRFARNTADCLHYTRELRDLGIGVWFEKEGIRTTDPGGELLFTILSSLAQEESRNISENTTWGIRSNFKKGKPHMNGDAIMGYKAGGHGRLEIHEEEAEVVRRIFREYLERRSPEEIARGLNRDGITGTRGKVSWSAVTIMRMLENEKFKGDLLLQNFYTVNYLTKKMTKNRGALDQYYVTDAHEPIISREMWEAVQQETAERRNYLIRHGLRKLSNADMGGFSGRVFCKHCGGRYIRHRGSWKTGSYWRCVNTEKKNGHVCSNGNIYDAVLRKQFMNAWKDYAISWDKKTQLSGMDSALTKYRRTMISELIEKELPVLLNEGIGKDIGLLTAEERRINVLAQKALLELYIENGDVCDVRFIC